MTKRQKNRQHNDQKENDNTMIGKAIHRNLKIEQYELHKSRPPFSRRRSSYGADVAVSVVSIIIWLSNRCIMMALFQKRVVHINFDTYVFIQTQ
jgi:hypothetical protein